jgi:hypothetical protein
MVGGGMFGEPAGYSVLLIVSVVVSVYHVIFHWGK